MTLWSVKRETATWYPDHDGGAGVLTFRAFTYPP